MEVWERVVKGDDQWKGVWLHAEKEHYRRDACFEYADGRLRCDPVELEKDEAPREELWDLTWQLRVTEK